MDGINLFVRFPDKLNSLLNLVYYLDTIWLKMNADKCAIIHIKRGKLPVGGNYKQMDE